MYIFSLLAFALLFFFFKGIYPSIILKATPAYVPKKRLPKIYRIPLPKDIPTFYY